MKDAKFIISEELFEKCTNFAKNSVSSSASKYAWRNQFNPDKIVEDIRNGKIAEEAVWQKLSIQFPNLSQPDFNIYDKKNKSWDPDLKDLSIPIKIAVKSQTENAAKLYGRSWVFQNRVGSKYDVDTGIFGADRDNHFVCFVSLDILNKCGELKALVKVSWLHDHELFKPMKKANLNSNKTAVYWNDIATMDDQLWQLEIK